MIIRPPKPSPLKQLGMSLVEVSVAALVLMISLAGVIKFETHLIGSLSAGRQQSVATQAAENLIEEFRSYTTIAKTSGQFAYDDIKKGDRKETRGNVEYKLKWKVDTFTDPAYKEIDLTVEWKDRYKKKHTLNFSTNIAKVDPTQTYTGSGNGNNGNSGNGNNGNGYGNGGGVLL